MRAETSTVAAEAERTFAVSRGAVNVRSTSPGRSATRSQLASLRAFYSSAFLDEDTTVVDDIKVLCAARVLLDLMPRLSDKGASRHVRDALRLKSVTALELNAMAAKHHGRRGVRRLKHYADLYGSLPVTRTRSDAEIVAAEWIAAARMPMPLINIVVAGEEGDLVYPEYGRIIELDGPQFHQFRAEDDRKQRIWEAAGWKVDRLPTDDVYDHPHKLLAIAPRHGDPKNPLSVRLPPPGGR